VHELPADDPVGLAVPLLEAALDQALDVPAMGFGLGEELARERSERRNGVPQKQDASAKKVFS
jgi:hypothetical protein